MRELDKLYCEYRLAYGRGCPLKESNLFFNEKEFLTGLYILGSYKDDKMVSNLIDIIPPEHIEKIQILMNNLREAPKKICEFKNLKQLILYFNKLKDLPEDIGKLENLEVLVVSNNLLTSLPESIGKLKNLRAVHLYGNKLTSLPNSIRNLTSLTYFDIRKNPNLKLDDSLLKFLKNKSFRVDYLSDV